jgi:hypothetical protein
MASSWLNFYLVNNAIDAEARRNDQTPNHIADRQITTMVAVIAPAATYGNQSACMSQLDPG